MEIDIEQLTKEAFDNIVREAEEQVIADMAEETLIGLPGICPD